jgi:AcrR family transcriptional regulator
LRDTIVAAATELLIEAGQAKAVSIRAVAERAGVTSPSIYLHFADKDALLDAVCAQFFGALDERMRSAGAACATPAESLHALGMAYVRFAVETPVLYRIATMGEPAQTGCIDGVLANSALVHLRTAVQALVDDGTYPRRDTTEMAFELWMVVHGLAAFLIAKPYWPLDDAEAVTDRLLHSMYCGQIAVGTTRYDHGPLWQVCREPR